MPTQLKEKIKISLDVNFSQSHTKCVPRYCVSKGGEICISEEFKEYLKKNNKIDENLLNRFERYKSGKKSEIDQFLIQYLSNKIDENQKISAEFQKNDLQWLIESDRNIKKIFKSSEAYRLRFKEHDIHASNFFEKIFQYYQKPICGEFLYDGKPFIRSFFDNQKYRELASNLYRQLWEKDILWTPNLKDNVRNYERYFSYLCENTRKESSSDIYRLFDISNKYTDNYKIELPNFLSLLYSLGHGDARRKKPETISEFISYFEFFSHFVIDCQLIYDKLAKKEGSFNCNNRAILDNFVFLASEEGLKKANEVWDLYYENAKQLFGTGIDFDEHITDENFVKSLKSHLNCTHSPFPINFSSLDSAVYHAYKHNDLCQVPSKEFPVGSYLELIKLVILNGSELPSRPDQFGKGRLFTFKKEVEIKGETTNVAVYILKGIHKSTFILSCH